MGNIVHLLLTSTPLALGTPFSLLVRFFADCQSSVQRSSCRLTVQVDPTRVWY